MNTLPTITLSIHLYRDREGQWCASVGDPGERVKFGPCDSVHTLLGSVATSVVAVMTFGGPVRPVNPRFRRSGWFS